MEFKQLRSFVEVIHRGGFTQAGKTLHISQSAVSKQVAQLEHSLGTPLLDRIGSQIRLTAAGQVVLQRAEAMLRLQNELLSELDDMQHLTRGELRLGLPQLGGDTLFADLFAEYRRRYPNVTIQLLEGGSRTIEQAILNGELDVGGCLNSSDPAFARQAFCDEPLDALLPMNHPLAQSTQVRTYDALGREVASDDSLVDGRPSETQYDARGNVIPDLSTTNWRISTPLRSKMVTVHLFGRFTILMRLSSLLRSYSEKA